MFCVQCGAAKDGSVAVCAACGHAPHVSDAPELGRRASEAVQDARAALLRLAPNPAGSLSSVFSSLGEQRALGAGLAMGAVFVLASTIAAWIGSVRIGIGFQPRVLFGALFVGAVFFASLAATGAAGRKLLRGTAIPSADVFVAGVALQPIAILLLASSILGGGNFGVIAVAAVLAWTYLLCILHAGLTRLGGVPEAFAPPLIAGMLLLSLWLSKVAIVAVGGGSNPLGSIFG